MKITGYKIKKAVLYLKHYGWKRFWVRVAERLEPDEVPYDPWYQKHKITQAEWDRQREDAESWENRPLFSICVPVYQTPELFLRQMIESLQAQSYTNWQLCLADGSPDDSVERQILTHWKEEKRISYRHLSGNLGIAGNTNAAFELAKGAWIGLLDHDDVLAPDALYEVLANAGINPAAASKAYAYDAAYWACHKQPDVIYTDEDKVSQDLKKHIKAHWKPDYSPDLLRSNNYITHFFAAKREIVEKAGGFDPAFDGAQDYDFIFRCTQEAHHVGHVPRILYHWRTSEGSTADNPISKQYAFEAGRRAIAENMKRQGIACEVEQTKDLGFYRVIYPVTGTPLVSIIIPNKDEAATLSTCLSSIAESSYPNLEVIIVENNSTDPETFAYYEKLTGQPYTKAGILEGTFAGTGKIKVVTWAGKFNYSAINNYGARYADGEYLILLNNDIELRTTDFIEELLGNCQRKEVGITGARLVYDDHTVQHAGIVVGIGGIAGNMFVGLPEERDGYLHRAVIQTNYSAVTAACLMVKRSIFDAVGGLTEELEVAFNDVDFCLKVRKLGYLVVYDPAVFAYHYESKSRGSEDTVEKVQRFEREIAYMKQKWQDIFTYGDPYYNQNLTLTKSNYSLKQNHT